MFTIKQIDPRGFDGNYSYLIIAEDRSAALVDPCGEPELLLKEIDSYRPFQPEYILITHDHKDHISALDAVLPFFQAKICASEHSSVPADLFVTDGTVLPFGNGSIEAIATPGHSEDSICWKLSDDSAIFTGDTLFVDYIGFCNAYKMFHSLERLRTLPESMIICSGHNYGHAPTDTIGHQKQVNPFFAPETFAGFKQALLDLR